MWRIIFLIILFLSGCGKDAVIAPPNIRYGSEPCSECHMLISDKHFAGAILTKSGIYEKFDDIGCMLKRLKTEMTVEEIWVNDFITEKWIRAQYAFYVNQDSIATPMGYGILAFSEKENALSFTSGKSENVLRFDELQPVYEKNLNIREKIT